MRWRLQLTNFHYVSVYVLRMYVCINVCTHVRILYVSGEAALLASVKMNRLLHVEGLVSWQVRARAISVRKQPVLCALTMSTKVL